MIAIGKFTELLRVLSDPTRQKLYRLLLHEELCVCELAAIFPVSQSAISQHLRRLKAIHLVNDRRRGQWVFYRGDPRPLEEAIRLLSSLASTPLPAQEDLRQEWEQLLHVKGLNLCGLRTPDGELDVPGWGITSEAFAIRSTSASQGEKEMGKS